MACRTACHFADGHMAPTVILFGAQDLLRLARLILRHPWQRTWSLLFLSPHVWDRQSLIEDVQQDRASMESI